MDFIERMNIAIDYIEEHLADEVDFRKLARLVGCSEYHLSRTFPFVTGQGLGQYIRRRRMSQAAMDLQSSDVDLLALAVQYGYSSVDSFTRSFREVHGVAPSAVRQGSAAVRAFPKLTFSIVIQGVVPMKYRITEKEAFRVVGIHKTVPLVFSGANPDIDALWKSLTLDQIQAWKALSNTEPRGIISASSHFSEGRMSGTGTLDHHIGVATTAHPSGESPLEVAAGTWAVFESVGPFPETLQTLWGRIYSEWFPPSEFELREGPEMLWNEGPDTSKPDFRSEIWIPVVRR